MRQQDHSTSNMYDIPPPSLMSMPIATYDNGNNNPNHSYLLGHDDYCDDQSFDIKLVTHEIPYYDLPAGLMCLLVKV